MLPNFFIDATLEHVTEEQLEKLKCVSCEAYLSNVPVFTLIDGKSVCHRCYYSNGPPISSIRNLAYETIASSFIFPCIYRFRGCTIRLKYGREMWNHEHECAYGQIQRSQILRKPSQQKNGKERGVIETHSGHYWGTITPHSALFAPPKTKKNDGKIVTQELEEVMKKKHKDDVDGKNFDAESLDSVMSKSTWDSLGDNISSHNIDNISRSTVDNISRASSRDQRYSNNPSFSGDYRASFNNNEQSRLEKIRQSNDDLGLNYVPYTEVQPAPLPAGFNRAPYGYYQDNVARFSALEQYGHLSHYPPILTETPVSPNGLNHTSSHNSSVKRTESARVGNASIINELKERNRKKISNASNGKNASEPTSPHDYNNGFM